MIQLDDRRVALELRKLIRREIDGALRTRVPVYHYGTVFSVDTVAKTCSVLLKGLAQPSPGFGYSGIEPRVDEFVRAFVNPNGDRYIDSVQGRDIVGEIVDVVTPPAIQPDRAFRIPVRIPIAAGIPDPVQFKHGNGLLTMDNPITPGNTLLYLAGVRSTTFGALPGYSVSPEGITADAPADKIAVYRKIAGIGEPDSLAGGSSNQGGVWIELPGVWNFDTHDHDDGTGTVETAGPITVAPDSFVFAVGGIGNGGGFDAATGYAMTPGGGWTELHDSGVTDGHPRVWVGMQYSAAGGSITGQATIAPADPFDWAMQVVALTRGSIEGSTLAPEATDHDDSSYIETSDAEAFRIDLGSAYRIVRSRLVIACEDAGEKAYELRGANEADFIDEVTLGVFSFEASGGFIPDDLTILWSTTTAYRYWRLVGPAETRRIHSFELYEEGAGQTVVTDPCTGDGAEIDDALAAIAASIITDHGDLVGRDVAEQHPASALLYDNLLSGMVADNVQSAIDELATMGPGALPWFFPEDYGAVGDDSTDDLAALDAAVTAAAAAGGGQIALPAKYAISGTLSISDPQIHLRGFGNEYGPSQLRITVADTTAIDFPSTWVDLSRTYQGSVRDLKVKGPGSATAGAGVKAASNIDLSHVGIHGFQDGIFWHTATYYSRARDCFITGSTRYGIHMSGCNNCTVDACRITGDPLGVTAIDPVAIGIFVNGGISNRIIWSSIEYYTGHGIVLAGGISPVVLGNYLETQQSTTGFTHIYVGQTAVTYSPLIENNYLQGDGIAGFTGMILDNAVGFRCHGNTLTGTLGTTSTGGGSGGFWWGNTVGSGTINLPSDTITSPGGMTNPMTTAGDLIKGGSSGAPGRLGIGSSGQILRVVSGAPAWSADDQLAGVAVSGTPSAGQALVASSSSAASWAAVVSALAGLSDVDLSSPAEDDTLRYVGGQWINDDRQFRPVTHDFGTGPELVWDGDDLVMEWF